MADIMNSSPFGMPPQRKSRGIFGNSPALGAGGGESTSIGGSPNANRAIPTGDAVRTPSFTPFGGGGGIFGRPGVPLTPPGIFNHGRRAEGGPLPVPPKPNIPTVPPSFTPTPNVPNESAVPYNYTEPTMTLLGMHDVLPGAAPPPRNALGGILGVGGGGGGIGIGPGQGRRLMLTR